MAQLPAGTFAYTTVTYSPSFARRLILDMPGEIRESPAFSPDYVLGITPDHTRVACIDSSFKLRVWNLDTDTIETPDEAAEPYLGLGYYGDSVMCPATGRVLCSSGLLDVATGVVTPSTLPSVYVDDAHFSPDGTKLYVVNYTAPYLHIYDVATGNEIAHSVVPPARPRTVRVSPDGSLVALGMPAPQYNAAVYRLDTGAAVQTLNAEFGDYYNAHFAPSGGRMVWSLQSEPSSLRLFDVPPSGLFGAPVRDFGEQYQRFAALVSDEFLLVPNDNYSQHGTNNYGRLLNVSDGSLERLLVGTLGSVALPPAYAGEPPPTPAFWTRLVRAEETA